MAASTENSALLSQLVSMLQACDGYSVSNSSQAMALAVPATHMRLTGFNGTILIKKLTSSSSSDPSSLLVNAGPPSAIFTRGAEQQIASSSAISSSDVGSGSSGRSSNASGTSFRGENIQALVVAPNAYFNLSVQLYDDLGQPVSTGK